MLINNFKQIFQKYETDKTELYSEAYNDAFENIRNDVSLVFEIGVYKGGGSRGFREYFPNAFILGIDINPTCIFEEKRIKVELGDSTDLDFLNNLIIKYGTPDVVIDDGGHFSNQINIAFDFLFPFTKMCYVIEDLGTQTNEYANGGYMHNGISATKIVHSVVEDLLIHKNILDSIKIYHSIAFIFKKYIK